LQVDQAKRLKELEQENAKLKRLVAELSLDKLVLDLLSKHQQMKKNPFLFLRGTFYRWAQQWSSICSELCKAPQILAVGDLHVNSFGT
jgi:uncharacterized protein (DUF2252 family)